MTNSIDDRVALSLTRQYLAGLRNFPALIEGQMFLAQTIQKAVLSVSHARATLELFDDQCPTPKEIKDTAFNLRPKFEPQQSDIEKWKAAGYTYDAGFYAQLMAEFNEQNKSNHDAELWAAIKARFKPGDPRTLSNGQLKSWKRQLGFPLNYYEQLDADQWEKGHPISRGVQ